MRRMPVCLLLSSVAILAAPIQDAVPAQAKSKRDAITIAAVRTVPGAQRDAWNRGDIEGYMDG